MRPTHEVPLTSEASGLDGVWVRSRAGPTSKAYSSEASVTVWHRVGGFGQWNRILTVCGRGPRGGFLWPSGGGRLEVARPGPYGHMPGSVCQRCREHPVVTAEGETLVPDEIDIDRLATLVAEHLLRLKEAPTDER